MQNAEMEFVTFDAQDVIATSGNPKTAMFTVSESLYTGPYTSYDGSSWSARWSKTGGGQFGLQVAGYQNLDGRSFVMTPGETQYMFQESGSDSILGIINAKEDSTADITLGSLDAILDWLKKACEVLQ